MTSETAPSELVLSVVLPSPAQVALLSRTIAALARQTVARRIELILVVRDASDVPDQESTAALGAVRVVTPRRWTTMTAARASGVLHARSRLVALAEDHCFPLPEWAEALIRAHDQPWAVVAPGFLNANPSTALSWANFVIEYGPWLMPVAAGACDHVPGHNACYKRDLLSPYSADLEAWLEAESVLHWDLGRRGYTLAMEPAAQTRHENFSRLAPSVALRYSVGRLFAASRGHAWPAWRRAIYAGGSALLPVLRTWRAWRQLRRVDLSVVRRIGVMGVAFVLLIVDAVGQGLGYALGPGSQAIRLSELEHDRYRFMIASDRDVAVP